MPIGKQNMLRIVTEAHKETFFPYEHEKKDQER